jgi:hypothetical protein
MILNYKTLTGCEVSYFEGSLDIYVPEGVYTLKVDTLHCHGAYTGSRHVTAEIIDSNAGFAQNVGLMYDDTFDDYEIINRWITGTASCDCTRGKLLYGETIKFKCNKGNNRFLLRKLTIKGEPKDCVIKFKAYL